MKLKTIIRKYKRWKYGKKIKFLYVSSHSCNLNHPEISHWGCCCQCVHRVKITKHCWHSNYTESCNCHEELGFYVCTLAHYIDEVREAHLCGEHGVCEGFMRIK